MARPDYDDTVGAKEIFGHDATNYQAILTDTDGKLIVMAMGALVPSKYDYIGLTRTGSNITSVVYKTGGAGGTVVSTLTIAYTGSDIDSITKT